jgi:hypothetical protein
MVDGRSIGHSHQPSAIRHREDPAMRFIHLFLIGYFVLVLGAVMALWKAGVLAHVSGTWVAIGTIIAVGLGIMLAVSSGKPEITRE